MKGFMLCNGHRKAYSFTYFENKEEAEIKKKEIEESKGEGEVWIEEVDIEKCKYCGKYKEKMEYVCLRCEKLINDAREEQQEYSKEHYGE